ncbi:MAG: helix-turn-helix domain-containing protein [Bacteroidota bacterium]
MTIQPFSLLFLFGTFQSLLMLIALHSESALPKAQKKLVSALLTILGVVLLYYVIIVNEYYSVYPYIDSLGTAAWMALMPTFYVLTKSLTNPSWQLKWRHIILFAVPLSFVAEGILTTAGLPIWLYAWVGNADRYLDIWMLLFFSTGLFFGVKSVSHLWTFDDSQLYRELKWFAYLFLLILLVFGLVFLFIRGNYVIHFELSLIALFEIAIFILVFKFFQANGIKNLFSPFKKSYATAQHSQLQLWSRQLEELMQNEKPFLDKKLNLNKLSAIAQRSPNDLSRLFSQYYQCNFYDFVNKYRLQHLERIIQRPGAEQYKIIALAEESGFNSKATFYKVFKEKHAMTPTQFLKQRKKPIDNSNMSADTSTTN